MLIEIVCQSDNERIMSTKKFNWDFCIFVDEIYCRKEPTFLWSFLLFRFGSMQSEGALKAKLM